MQRTALRRILRGALCAALPLALAATQHGCIFGSSSNCGSQTAQGNVSLSQLADGGVLSPADKCAQACELVAPVAINTIDSCVLSAGDGGESTVFVDCKFQVQCVGGRAPAGLARVEMTSHGAVGEHLARMAHLEAASVIAFARLDKELDNLGAPASLRLAARRAIADERRHARVMATLAWKHGAAVPPVEVSAPQPRKLVDMAIENAVEGCVRETWGALVAGWQAARAEDDGVRAAMRAIERDETRHAELAWEVARFADARLDDDERIRVTSARAIAVEELRASLSHEQPREVTTALGLPTPSDAARLHAHLAATLWV